MLLFTATHFIGSMFISNCRETKGCNLPTPKKILAARICTFSTGPSYAPPPHTSALCNSTDSTRDYISLTKVAPLLSPMVALHLLSQSLRALAPTFPLSSTILVSCRCSSITHPRYLYSCTTAISSPPTWNWSKFTDYQILFYSLNEYIIKLTAKHNYIIIFTQLHIDEDIILCKHVNHIRCRICVLQDHMLQRHEGWKKFILFIGLLYT